MVDQHPESYIKYHRGIEKCFGFLSNRTKRDWKTEVIVYYGEPGTGKSRTAKEVADSRGGEPFYKSRGEWWDGYKGEETIIIDDFYGWLKFDEMLRIMDRYPLSVPVKGGFVEFLGRLLIVTSNRAIGDWWSGQWFGDQQYKAIERRLTTYEYWQFIGTECIRTNLLSLEPINDLLN